MRFLILSAIIGLLPLHWLYSSNSHFINYKQKLLAVKFTESKLNRLNSPLFEKGLTGIQKVDDISRQYGSSHIQPHFRAKSTTFSHSDVNELKAWFKITFKNSINIKEAAGAYDQLAEVISSDPIPVHEAFKTSDDPNVSQQWHIDQANDADIDAPEGWDINTGNEAIIVAVMDTGVEWWHRDLAGSAADNTDRNTILGNLWINASELSNTSSSVDEDGNGYDDDWVGWDFVTGNPQTVDLGDDYDDEDNNPSDHHGHGTHCAGNVASINNNGQGVASASGGWGEDASGKGNGVKIMSLRIGWDDFPSGRVSMDFAANAFLYAAENGAQIATCSWGSSEYGPLVDAINTFIYGSTNPQSGDPKIRLIFKAAGNDGDEDTDYMTARDDIVSVAATQSDDNAATGFTSYGSWVDISAPGDDIYSTYNGGGYASLSGTSMATPMAASVAAGIWSRNSQLNAEEVETYLYDGADDISSTLDAKYIGKMGAGRVNLYNSLQLTPAGGSNNAPIAVDDDATTDEDQTVTVDVLANDSDADGDTLTIFDVFEPENGTAVINIDSTITYTPDTNFNGADQFDYVISDGNNGNDTATVSVTVNAVNDRPVAVSDDTTTNEDTAVYIAVLINDTDVDNDPLSINDITAEPQNGTATNNGSEILYTPAENFVGTDQFQYEITDGMGGADSALVTVSVNAVNDAPVAVEDSSTVEEDSTVFIFVLQNDSDSDGDSLMITSVNEAINGVVNTQGDSAIQYTPNADFFGADSFIYFVTDGQAEDSTMVFVDVFDINDPPQITNLPGEVTLETNDSTKLKMSTYASDIDTPDSLLSWTFEVSDPAIGYAYDEINDTLTIYSNEQIGDYNLFCTLTDDSLATDKDTIIVHVDITLSLKAPLDKTPEQFMLKQNFPNPFNPSTTIKYGLPHSANVSIDIYSVNGKRVA
ncbi:MAG: tandem-95 repeat protein, partial [Caldithrix sp.]|nr:tandem-95 repeat protein [Caldithrix sp.]